MLFLTEPVDEYCVQAMPEYDGKKFQNIAKVRIASFSRSHGQTFLIKVPGWNSLNLKCFQEGVNVDDGEKAKEAHKALEETFKPLTTWLKENGGLL